MSYFLDLFSPATYDGWSRSDRQVSGFRRRHLGTASRIKPGDKFLCYMTKLSRWVGVLEVLEGHYLDDSSGHSEDADPFVVRFRVQPIVWLPVEKGIPIYEDRIWNALSFTRGHTKGSSTWTGKVRGSLAQIADNDGVVIESALRAQVTDGTTYSYDETDFRRFVGHVVRRADKDVTVTVPEDTDAVTELPIVAPEEARESHRIQALLADIGSRMGMQIWLPRSDRTAVLGEWHGDTSSLLDRLPLNYDDTTLKTIEQIDVLWLKGRAIRRAFEVEHTTSIYSGILRMADLLALQPNMNISLHIVAPVARREKVLQEIRRPVFSFLDRGPLSESCTFLSYDSIRELAEQPHLQYLSDSVLDEYEEEAV